jgi:hypothetical protein
VSILNLNSIPNHHIRTTAVSGWYLRDGLYVSPLAIAKHRMAGNPPASFTYERWRHGGWYVAEVTWPNGGCGCVTRNFPDRKWRIACDNRPFDQQPTFRTRDDGARGE